MCGCKFVFRNLFSPSCFLVTLFRGQMKRCCKSWKSVGAVYLEIPIPTGRAAIGRAGYRKNILLLWCPHRPLRGTSPVGRGIISLRHQYAIPFAVRPVIFEYTPTTTRNSCGSNAAWQCIDALFPEATNVLWSNGRSLICGDYWLSSSYCKRLWVI